MFQTTRVDGIMVSRGALGNPWIFREIKGDTQPVTVQDWRQAVIDHLRWQEAAYGRTGMGAICMRKHLLWYARGWPGARQLREKINVAEDIQEAMNLILEFAEQLEAKQIHHRLPIYDSGLQNRFVWDPKYEMHRQLDRGVGEEGLCEESIDTGR